MKIVAPKGAQNAVKVYVSEKIKLITFQNFTPKGGQVPKEKFHSARKQNHPRASCEHQHLSTILSLCSIAHSFGAKPQPIPILAS